MTGEDCVDNREENRLYNLISNAHCPKSSALLYVILTVFRGFSYEKRNQKYRRPRNIRKPCKSFFSVKYSAVGIHNLGLNRLLICLLRILLNRLLICLLRVLLNRLLICLLRVLLNRLLICLLRILLNILLSGLLRVIYGSTAV